VTEGSTLRDAEPVFPSRLPPAQLRFADALVLCMCAGTASHALATTPSSNAKTHVEQKRQLSRRNFAVTSQNLRIRQVWVRYGTCKKTVCEAIKMSQKHDKSVGAPKTAHSEDVFNRNRADAGKKWNPTTEIVCWLGMLTSRWSPNGEPANATVGLYACLLAMASSESSDLAETARVTGIYPLFVLAVQWVLLQSETWRGPAGKKELARLLSLRPRDADEVQDHLEFLVEWIWGEPSRHALDLGRVWELCTTRQRPYMAQ